MSRHFLVAGFDFGTSFSKVVLREQNTGKAVVVTFEGHQDGLLPSLIAIDGLRLLPPGALGSGELIPYLKMVAGDVGAGMSVHESQVRLPETVHALCHTASDRSVIRNLLAFYFSHVIAAVQEFVRTGSPWEDFEFNGGQRDHLIFQLAVPTGLLAISGTVEKLFRDALIAAYQLNQHADSHLRSPIDYHRWAVMMDSVIGEGQNNDNRFDWQCLLYPEVAAAVQTVFRSPNARDGLYITMDVGAGTTDANAFRRQSRGPTSNRRLDYYAAAVSRLGVQNLKDPYHAVVLRDEAELREEVREDLQALYRRATHYQPNHGTHIGQRTWDDAFLLIFGGGSTHSAYRTSFVAGMEGIGIFRPRVQNLPSAHDIKCPRGTNFGRFAVAYGMSFFKPSLDEVRLPSELVPFNDLYPTPQEAPPRRYGFDWSD